MSKYDVNIIGEPFQKFVGDQIKVRQKIHGAGISSTKRTPQELQYLNGSNSWVKMASSVSIEDPQRLEKIGFSQQESMNLKGTNLARDYVLFNGTSAVSNPLQRFGVSDNGSKVTTANYGTAGVDDFGLQAMPGIQSFSVSHNNLGSIRTGEIKLRANSLRQFNILELLYIRLGYTILVEWGNGIFFNNNEEFSTMGQTLIDDTKNGWFALEDTTHLEFYSKINKIREQYDGNYDAFFCKVRNFEWSFNPEGYYDITLSLVSLGDVVESLRINTLSGNNTISQTDLIKGQVNLSDIQNLLYCKLKNIDVDSDPLAIRDYVKVGIKNLEKKAPTFKSYIRFGTFLEWIEKNLIPHIENGDKSEPLLSINTTDYNYMRNFKGLMSTNPNTCVIKNILPRYYDSAEIIGDKDTTKNLFKDFYSIGELTPSSENTPLEGPQEEDIAEQDPLISGDFSRSPGARSVNVDNLPENMGRIMNIYLNMDFIDNILKEKEKDILRLDFYTFIKSICSSINSCFGGYINLEPTIQNEKVFVIVDRNLISRTGKDGRPLSAKEQSPVLNIYGIDNDDNTSSFVKDLQFKTEVSKELASMIAIGAIANNQSKIELSDFFNNINKGLKDRFQQKSSDGEKDDKKKKEEKLECAEDSDKQQKNVRYVPTYTFQGIRVFRPEEVTDGEEQEEPKTFTDDVEDDNRKQLELFRRQYQDYLKDMFGLPSFKTGITNKPSFYFRADDKNISRGKTLLESYINKYIQVATQKNREKGLVTHSSLIGFIPIDINLTLKGLGGVRIYNQLLADTRFLPQDYPDNVEFVIKGVQHEVVDNEWTTTLQAISKPKGVIIDVSLDVEGEETVQQTQPEIEEEVEGLIFYPPIGSVASQVIRDDSGGNGQFGSRREGGREHAGVDYKTKVGDPIFSPIKGRLQVTKATEKSKLKGFKILGTNQYAGYTVYIFYAKPDPSLIGSYVDAGQIVATAQDLSPDYPIKVTDHVHVKITRGDAVINPESVNYQVTFL
jgi:hypothetical protein